jgi:ABC-2 type transport system permease protein
MVVATMKRAFAEAWSRRSSFWFQISIMVLNDAAFVVFWFLFFNEVGEVRGWDAKDTLLLLSMLATSAGIVLGLFANSRHLGEMVAGGRMDAVLALPVNPLAYLLVRRIDPALLGDVAFGPILFVALGGVTLERTVLYIAGSMVGAVVFLSFLVILGSLTFFLGGRGEHADFGFQAVLILASYPLEIFGGPTRLLLFTVIPAAFVTGLPTRLVDDFAWSTIGALVAVATAMGVGAYATFSAGLRRYRSGSVWTEA